MPTAVCLIRSTPHYRRDAFVAGLKTCGFTLSDDEHHRPQPGDVLVIWNRYAWWHEAALRFEAAKAAVIVAENGYLGHMYDPFAKAADRDGQGLYAMSLWYHNGAGEWPVGDAGRWIEQGIEIHPWRDNGTHVLMLPQRGIGPEGVAMPADWLEKTKPLLQQRTKRPVKVRAHPGNEPAKRPLADDLEDCWCAVTWGSGAGLKALCAGVPVFSDFVRWIGRGASLDISDNLENPLRDDWARETMLDRLSWAQWSIPEIGSGLPFALLMELYRKERLSAS